MPVVSAQNGSAPWARRTLATPTRPARHATWSCVQPKSPHLRIDVDVFQEQAHAGRAVGAGLVAVLLPIGKIFVDAIVFDVLVRGGATREEEWRHDGRLQSRVIDELASDGRRRVDHISCTSRPPSRRARSTLAPSRGSHEIGRIAVASSALPLGATMVLVIVASAALDEQPDEVRVPAAAREELHALVRAVHRVSILAPASRHISTVATSPTHDAWMIKS